MSRAQLTSTVEQNSGGAVAPLVAGKNAIINGGMDIAQRGISISVPAGPVYTLDRWAVNVSIATTSTVSRISSGLTGFQYALRWQRPSGTTTTPLFVLAQSIETVNSIPFAGKQITFSFYIRTGTNFSAPGVNYLLSSGTGTDENLLNGFTGGTTLITNGVLANTSWQRVTGTATVPSNATQLGIYFNYTAIGTAGANDYFDITGVQLELGSVATTFSRAGGSIGGELALCQRYYWRSVSTGTSNAISFGTAKSTTVVGAAIEPPQTLRITPTILECPNLSVYDGATLTVVTTAVTNSTLPSTPDYMYIEITVASGLTQFRPYYVIATNTTGYIGFSAEL